MAAYESDPQPYLLSRRGALAQCLGQDAKVFADLTAFVDQHSEDETLSARR